ncbi:MAG: WYL domain-containing protein [Prolixibacteraceae bacterium]|nr:WYL domain-containing protein [Prolixibacteraceae bacterium]
MATNKNAAIRYQALNQCFRNPGRIYYIDDLIEACNKSLLDIDPNSTGIKRRQLFDDIKFMRDSQGYDAPIESFKDGKKAYYRYSDLSYSINNQPLNEREAQQLKESLMTLSRFKGLPQFEWVDEMKARLEVSFRLKSQEKVIEFEENQYLTGKEHIGALYDAIINKQALKIKYHPFKRDESILMVLHPYFLKQYNNRWFLFGKSGDAKTVTTIALDRIELIQPVSEVFQPNTEINFEEYFEDVVGVSVPYDGIADIVILKIDTDSWPYIKTKPIHGSQKVKEQTSKYTIIELQVIPNFELEAVIFSHAEKIEVISPEILRQRVKDRIIQLKEKYT